MRFETIIPTISLRPYIRHFAISENGAPTQYKVYPGTGLVAGFQFKGILKNMTAGEDSILSTAGITGITDQYRIFGNPGAVASILVYFTETGLSHFSSLPAHELFNQSITMETVFPPAMIREAEEKLYLARTDKQRIRIVETFFLSLLKEIQTDKLILEAIKLIHGTKGAIRIRELQQTLFISQSPFEKRFRKLVGTTPKKFASIVRFNHILANLSHLPSMTEAGYENNFFDQSHFIHEFKRFTGETPEQFKRLL